MMMKPMICKTSEADEEQGAMGGLGVSENTVPTGLTGLRHHKATATATSTDTSHSTSEWPKKTEFGTIYRIGIDEIPTGPTETPLSKSEERSWVFFQQRHITRSSSSSASASASKSSSR